MVHRNLWRCQGPNSTGQGVGMPYFAHISQRGPVKNDQVPGSIGVLEAIDKPMPIGEARRGMSTGSLCGRSGSASKR